MLLAALLLLIPLLLMLRGWDDRRLNLLQKCLLVSLLIHVLLSILLSLVFVSKEIVTYVRREAGLEEVRVELVGTGGSDIGMEVRQQITDTPVEMPAPDGGGAGRRSPARRRHRAAGERTGECAAGGAAVGDDGRPADGAGAAAAACGRRAGDGGGAQPQRQVKSPSTRSTGSAPDARTGAAGRSRSGDGDAGGFGHATGRRGRGGDAERAGDAAGGAVAGGGTRPAAGARQCLRDRLQPLRSGSGGYADPAGAPGAGEKVAAADVPQARATSDAQPAAQRQAASDVPSAAPAAVSVAARGNFGGSGCSAQLHRGDGRRAPCPAGVAEVRPDSETTPTDITVAVPGAAAARLQLPKPRPSPQPRRRGGTGGRGCQRTRGFRLTAVDRDFTGTRRSGRGRR